MERVGTRSRRVGSRSASDNFYPASSGLVFPVEMDGSIEQEFRCTTRAVMTHHLFSSVNLACPSTTNRPRTTLETKATRMHLYDMRSETFDMSHPLAVP